jgi:hypothetical protein
LVTVFSLLTDSSGPNQMVRRWIHQKTRFHAAGAVRIQ